MIDINDLNELLNLTEELKEVADKLQVSLVSSAKAKGEIDRLLATKIDELMAKKRNIGIDMAHIIMISQDASIFEKYSLMLNLNAECKGLEAVKSALETQITMVQSILKYTKLQGG